MIPAIIKLTRWKEHVSFVFPLSIVGTLLAVKYSHLPIGYNFLLIAIANFLAVSFAFMINDIEDAEDDARDPKRKIRNPISNKDISKKAAYIATFATAFLASYFYSMGGALTLRIGMLILVLGFLYSWRAIRLKAWPVTDIVSHALMLSGLLYWASYVAITHTFQGGWIVFCAVTLVSAYGQLYNQLRDFELDKKAKLKNTAILIGRDSAQTLMYTLLFGATSFFAIAIYKSAFPYWLIIPIIVAIPVGLKLRSGKDPRGTIAFDVTGDLQQTFWFVVNIAVGSWLVVSML